MSRIGIGVGLALLMVCTIPAAEAAGIAVVKSSDHASFDELVSRLHKACEAATGLREFNLKGDEGGWKEVEQGIRGEVPSLVIAVGPLAARLAKERLAVDVPVLYSMVPNPDRYDLTGDNIAGISLDIPGDVQFARYKTVLPNLHRIGVIYDPKKSATLVEQAKVDAAKLGLELLATQVRSPKEVPAALRSMLGKIDALWTVPDDTVLTNESFRFILVSSLEKKLPFFAMSEIFVKVGALATIAPVPESLAHQLCDLVERHGRGNLNLAEIDIVPPATSQLVINSKTAKKIGLSLTQEAIASASTVY